MSRYRRHKDAAHPGVVAALLGAGAVVVVVEGARWAGGGRKQQTAGSPDLLAGIHGRWVALEVKTPGQDRNRGPRAREQLEHQRAFRVCADLQQLPAYVVSTPLEALAAIGCTAVEAKRGLVAAGEDVSMWNLVAVEDALFEARQRLGVGVPLRDHKVDAAAYAASAVVRTHDGPAPKKR